MTLPNRQSTASPVLHRRRPDVRIITSFALNVLAGVVSWATTKDLRLALLVTAAFGVVFATAYYAGRPLLTLWRFHSGLQAYGIVGYHVSQAACLADLRRLVESAARVDILAIRGLGLFALTDSVMRATLVRRRAQLTVRVLMLDPASSFVKARAMEVGDEAESLRSGIRLSRKSVDEMRRMGVDITSRYYSRLAVWRLTMLDDRMFVSGFVPSIEGHDFPVLELKYTGPRSLFAVLKKQFEEMWDAAEVPATPKKSGA